MPVYNAPLKAVDPVETKRYAGLNKAEFNQDRIHAACREIQVFAEPKGIWQVYEYNARTGEIKAVPPVCINREKIRKHLALAEKVVVLAVTVGEAVEIQIQDYFKQGKYSHSLLLDAAATTAVEQAADDMEKAIRQQVAPLGYEMVWRFSPGYGDWDIHFQPEMLRLSQAATIEIGLTDSMMLLPRKSITAIIGLIPKENFCEQKKSIHNCQACAKQDCLARRK